MFNPRVGQELQIDGTTWQIVQHPGAPDMPYGQEGRAAIVYQLCSKQHRYGHAVVLLGPGGGVFEVPADGSPLRLGRGPDNDAVFSEAAVSREHGALVVKDGSLYVWDNSSRNGSFIDGKRVEPQQWVEVPPGSRLQLGTVEEGATLAVRPEAVLCRGLKAFKARFRQPAQAAVAARLAAFADLPGLTVCRRQVLTPETHATLIQVEPELVYGVVMPWVEGRSWMEMVMDRQLFTPERSLAAAQQFLEILIKMEERGVAHCDISGPNVNVEQSSSSGLRIHLVDVEQLYGPGLTKPDDVFAGSPGYAHKGLGDYAWSAESDRFSGAVMLCEMLAWSDPAMAKVAWSESFFDPNEMQTLCSRSQEMKAFLSDTFGSNLARLFDRIWSSDTPAHCPTFNEWRQAMPGKAAGAAAQVTRINLAGDPQTSAKLAAAEAAVGLAPAPPAVAPPAPAATPASAPAPALVSAEANAHMDRARKLEGAGDLAGALAAYRQAMTAAGPDSATGREVALIVAELEKTVAGSNAAARPAPATPPPAAAPPPPAAAPPAAAPAPVAAGSGKVKADPALVARIRELEGAPGIAPTAPPKPPPKPSNAGAYAFIVVGLLLLGGFLFKYGPTMGSKGDMKVAFVEPAEGAVIKSPTLLKATVENNTGKETDTVTFFLDNKPVGMGTLEGGVYQCNWDGQAEPGPHVFTVNATSKSGMEIPASVSVKVPISGQLTLIAPKGGSGTINLAADLENCSADASEVIFEANGKPVGNDAVPPFMTQWDSTSLPAGPVQVRARAKFADGSEIESEQATLNLTKSVEITFYATVTDPQGGHPLNLVAEDFVVKEDGTLQKELKVALSTEEAIVTAVIVIDHSGSMGGSMDGAIAAAASFVEKLRPKDRMAVVSFSDRPEIAVKFTSDRKRLQGAISKLTPHGGTSLYDAINTACDLLAGQPGRHAIILLTDGKDENARGNGPGSTHTKKQITDRLAKGEVTVFSLGLGHGIDKKLLTELATSSGGRAHLKDEVDQLKKAYDDVADELRKQYVLTWPTTHLQRDGKWRRVDITLVKKPGFKVSAQPGYKAPGR